MLQYVPGRRPITATLMNECMKRTLLQLGCILALLVSQHIALTHAIWHAQDRPSAYSHAAAWHIPAPDVGSGRSSPESGLCGFHLSLGEVLGGACGASTNPAVINPDAEREARATPSRLSVEPVHAVSRGPPTLL